LGKDVGEKSTRDLNNDWFKNLIEYYKRRGDANDEIRFDPIENAFAKIFWGGNQEKSNTEGSEGGARRANERKKIDRTIYGGKLRDRMVRPKVKVSLSWGSCKSDATNSDAR